MSDVWTVRKVLEWTAKDFVGRGIESARLDGELLVGEALGLTRVQVYLDLDRPLAAVELAAIRALVGRRRTREPIAYILGRKDFYGATFAVDSRVLVPRPDTETLVERALAHVLHDTNARWLDVCTGSGAVPVSLVRNRRTVTAVATDVSLDALAVARTNALTLGVADRIEFRLGDLYAALASNERFDGITANPPYIPAAELEHLMPDVARFEPRLALDGGASGLDFYPKLVSGAGDVLNDGAPLLLEVGAGQASCVAALFDSDGRYEASVVTNDYGGVARVVEARRKPR